MDAGGVGAAAASSDDGTERAAKRIKKEDGTAGIAPEAKLEQVGEAERREPVPGEDAPHFLERGDKCDACEEEIETNEVHIKSAKHPSIDISVEVPPPPASLAESPSLGVGWRAPM